MFKILLFLINEKTKFSSLKVTNKTIYEKKINIKVEKKPLFDFAFAKEILLTKSTLVRGFQNLRHPQYKKSNNNYN